MKKRFLIISLLPLAIGGLAGCQNVPAKVVKQETKIETTVKKAPASDWPTVKEYYNEPSIMIHYQRSEEPYDPEWGLWLWAEGKDGAEYEFNYSDDYGLIAYYRLADFNNPRSIGFIVKRLAKYTGGEWEKEGLSDRFMDIDMIQIDEHQCYNVYISSSARQSVFTDPERKHQLNAVKAVEFQSSTQFLLNTNNPTKSVVIRRNGVVETPTKVEEKNIMNDNGTAIATYGLLFTLGTKADIADEFRVTVTFEDDTSVVKAISVRKLYDEDFDAKYNYDGELGAIYSATKTTFKVWSPISSSIELRIYENGTPKSVNKTLGDDTFTSYPMEKGEKGVFAVDVAGDLQGKYYTYVVTNSSNPDGKEIVDPYAKSAGVNGLRGMVVDFARTNPAGWDKVDYLAYDRKALTVYETHIAELTCSDTWGGDADKAKKYEGFYQSGTTYTENGVTVKTGFDHIKELGVNAVQIIPFFDQANDEVNMTFNWGYNPLNYNVLEGGYSSNPYDGYARIKEFKALLKAYHDEGITIIMDVVYNHVNGLSGSNFDVLMPFYYFRYTETGGASNGSGCGNETASDKYMFRKFMIDSTCFWTSEYKLGGFRFDLMGIHDIETMNQLTAKNKDINPNIVIYGEPWAGGTTALPKGVEAAVQVKASKYQGYGQFNDKLRDAMVKSGMNSGYSRGWITQTKYAVAPAELVPGIQGITAGCTDDPNKSVIYATCHDNYTLHDRVVTADITNNDIARENYKSEEVIEKMNALANSIVFTSQGTSFMLAGEEMLRTKIVYDEDGNPMNAVDADGNELEGIPAVSGNSYNSSYKTNEINYSWKIKHLNLFKTYQKLIALKQNASGLHATDPNSVEILADGNLIKVTFKDGDKTYVAYHRNGVETSNSLNAGKVALAILTLGLTACSGTVDENVVDTTGYTLYMDSLNREFDQKSMTLQPFETLIMYK